MLESAAPAIILVAPQMGENIGASARVMRNFGLTDLRIVAPRDGWPNAAAQTMSAGAFDAGVTASVFDDLSDAIADLTLVLATTARQRGLEKPVYSTAQAIKRLSKETGRSGILFGAEKSGLPNEAVAVADAILTYPVDAGFSSLNLAQAVGAFAHAWAEHAVQESPLTPAMSEPAAPKADLIGMMEHFETELDRAGFFYPAEKRTVMVANLRSAFARAGWTRQEVRTFRGAIKALAVGRGKARIAREPDD